MSRPEGAAQAPEDRPGRGALDRLARDERRIAPAPGETIDLGEIVLSPGVDIVGRVVGAQGEPVAGAEVSVGDTSADAQRVVTTGDGAFVLHHMALGECWLTLRATSRVKRDRFVALDAAGRFETRLVAGHYELEVHLDGMSVVARAAVDLVEGEDCAVTVRLPR